MLACFQGTFEGGLFAGGQAFESLIQTVKHGFGAELVAHAFLGVDHFAVDFGGQVDVGIVTLGGRAIHTHEGAETLAQGFQTVVDVFVGDFGLATSISMPSISGSSMSGRRSTVATNFSLVSSLADSGTS